ncbi:hypothetical protein LAPL110952_10650 [Lactiplantibacillus plajomi]
MNCNIPLWFHESEQSGFHKKLMFKRVVKKRAMLT